VATLVQKNATVNVKAGENRGVKLSQNNVVRSYLKKTAEDKIEFDFELPGNLANVNWQLVIYTQQKKDLKISGAVIYQPPL
jgi:hypothetical protein